MAVHGALARKDGRCVLELVVHNKAGAAPISNTTLRFNKHPLGITPVSLSVVFSPIAVGGSGYVAAPITTSPAQVGPGPAGATAEVVQGGLKDDVSGRLVVFMLPVAYQALFAADGAIERVAFVEQWRTLAGADHEVAAIAKEVVSTDPTAVKAHLEGKGLVWLASRPGPDASLALHYFSAKAPDATGAPMGAALLYELTFKTGVPAIKVTTKTASAAPVLQLASAAMLAALA